MNELDLTDRMRGCLLGLAVGDAVGTTVEFKPRGSFPDLTDMVGGGPFALEPGQWTDDTSMALCLATSLFEKNGFDARDQIERYCRWADEGYLSSRGDCFDIGSTVSGALGRYKSSGNPFAGSRDPYSAGNGSIMRLAPVPMFYYPDQEQACHYAAESSRTTHGTLECLDACRFMAGVICIALGGHGRQEVHLGQKDSFSGAPGILAIAQGGYQSRKREGIRGSGYVVESLEAALWCLDRTDDFESAILEAANLGDDADTTAAVCGQIAGALYGESGIPGEWLEKLFMREEITLLADKLGHATP